MCRLISKRLLKKNHAKLITGSDHWCVYMWCKIAARAGKLEINRWYGE